MEPQIALLEVPVHDRPEQLGAADEVGGHARPGAGVVLEPAAEAPVEPPRPGDEHVVDPLRRAGLAPHERDQRVDIDAHHLPVDTEGVRAFRDARN